VVENYSTSTDKTSVPRVVLRGSSCGAPLLLLTRADSAGELQWPREGKGASESATVLARGRDDWLRGVRVASVHGVQLVVEDRDRRCQTPREPDGAKQSLTPSALRSRTRTRTTLHESLDASSVCAASATLWVLCRRPCRRTRDVDALPLLLCASPCRVSSHVAHPAHVFHLDSGARCCGTLLPV
jgi:hypothetical protein